MAFRGGLPGVVSTVALAVPLSVSIAEAANRCDVSPGRSSETIVVGNLLLGAEGADRGAVLVVDGRIAAVGEPEDVRSSAPEATVIDCGSLHVSPGFINAHEHPRSSGGFPDPGMRPAYSHRDEWQGNAGAEHYELQWAAAEDPIHQFWIELRHLLAGTTTLAGSGAVPGLLKNASWRDEPAYVYPADTRTFPYGVATETFAGLPCPYEGPSTFDPALGRGFPPTAPYTPHIAEGTNCTAALEGRFYLDYVARNPGRRYALVHGVGLDAASIERLGDLDVTLVWSPRSNLALYGATVDMPAALRAGARVAIGTDWSYSGSYNLFEEFRCAEGVDRELWDDSLSARDLWRMATEHAAYALGIERLTGKLEPGLAADLLVFENRADDPYAGLVDSTTADVVATFVDGELVSGRSDAFDAAQLPATCGNPIGEHFLCVDYAAYGFGHDELLRANEQAIPLFSNERQASCGAFERPRR
ncbi:MAG: amidohydrolase family protein [Acidobacteria bacterium]|nr:amidohydrolase family protein [Acidobacteriota bacterium]